MPYTTQASPKDIARLVGYNAEGVVVYSEALERGDYWDGDHIWDSHARIRALGMVKLVGELYDEKGLLYQRFENAYSASTGELKGSKASWADGTEQAFGTLGAQE